MQHIICAHTRRQCRRVRVADVGWRRSWRCRRNGAQQLRHRLPGAGRGQVKEDTRTSALYNGRVAATRVAGVGLTAPIGLASGGRSCPAGALGLHAEEVGGAFVAAKSAESVAPYTDRLRRFGAADRSIHMSHVPRRHAAAGKGIPSVNVGDHVGADVAGADVGGVVSPVLVGVKVGDAVGAAQIPPMREDIGHTPRASPTTTIGAHSCPPIPRE